MSLEFQTAAGTRLESGVASVMRLIEPRAAAYTAQIEALNHLPYSTIKQRAVWGRKAWRITRSFVDEILSALGPELQRHYTASLNSCVSGAVDAVGRSGQKRAFRKDRVEKALDLDPLRTQLLRVMGTGVQLQMQRKRYEEGFRVIFKSGGDAP